MSPLRVTEAKTRYSLIDPQLAKAGWNPSDRTQIEFKIPMDGYDGSGGGSRRLYSSNLPQCLPVQSLGVGVSCIKS